MRALPQGPFSSVSIFNRKTQFKNQISSQFNSSLRRRNLELASLGIRIAASHKTLRGSVYGADAREGRRSSSQWRNHRLTLQRHCCPLLGPPSALTSWRAATGILAPCTASIPAMSQAQGEATHCGRTVTWSPISKSTGFPARPQRPNYRVKVAQKGNKLGLNILNWVRKQQEGRGTDNGFGEEVRAQSIAPPLVSSAQEGCPPEERLQSHGIVLQLFPFRLAPTFWLQKLSWQQILPCKFITSLYTKLPESFIATYLTISAFASVIKEINRSWERISMEKGPLLWRNNSLGLLEMSKHCPASETD